MRRSDTWCSSWASACLCKACKPTLRRSCAGGTRALGAGRSPSRRGLYQSRHLQSLTKGSHARSRASRCASRSAIASTSMRRTEHVASAGHVQLFPMCGGRSLAELGPGLLVRRLRPWRRAKRSCSRYVGCMHVLDSSNTFGVCRLYRLSYVFLSADADFGRFGVRVSANAVSARPR